MTAASLPHHCDHHVFAGKEQELATSLSALCLLERLVHATRHPALLDPLFSALIVPHDQPDTQLAKVKLRSVLYKSTGILPIIQVPLTDVICRLLACPVSRRACSQHCRVRTGPRQQQLCSCSWPCSVLTQSTQT